MAYIIEEFDEILVVGIKQCVSIAKAFKVIPTLWRTANKNGLRQRLIDMSWENPKCCLGGILGVCGENAAIIDKEFNYFMTVRYDNEIPDDMESLVIPKSTWAVFPNVADAWKRLYTEWLPTSGYELADLPCIECYYAPKHKPRHELWVPILKTI